MPQTAGSPVIQADPASLPLRWSADEPLCAILTCDDPAGRGLLARPAETRVLLATPGGPRWRGEDTLAADPIGDIAGLLESPSPGGWAGWLAYELGEFAEPASRRDTPRPARSGLPLAVLCQLDDAWTCTPDGWAPRGNPPAISPSDHADFRLGAFDAQREGGAFRAAVAEARELICAGDVFQVNLTHRLRAPLAGSARGLAAAWFDAAAPRYGALFDLGEGLPTVLSASPELFLDISPDRRIRTKPMKGTRRAASHTERDLSSSSKDAAELAMIVDLMRNDLGRVARFGTVRVEDAQTIERHGRADTLLQGVATVAAELRDGVTTADVLRAAFPAGSITGAPKVRAMQIIRALEPEARGPYCGSVVYASPTGRLTMSVGIRTATIHEGTLTYGCGAGIVADSDPDAEWAETLAKAEQILSLSEDRRG